MALMFSGFFRHTLTNSLETTPPVAFHQFEYGRIHNLTDGSITLTVYESTQHDGTYVKCIDAGTSGVLTAIGANESIEIPMKLAGSRFLKFTTASGTAAVAFTMKG